MDKIKKYYCVDTKTYKDEPLAYAPEGTPIGFQLYDMIKDLDELPFEFTLYDVRRSNQIKKIGISDKRPKDYMIAKTLPILSAKMKDIIESKLNGNEGVRWMPAKIQNATDTFQYFVPVFTKFLDTLDIEHTLFSICTEESFIKPYRNIIKPYFKASVVQQYGMFHDCGPCWQFTLGIYLRADIMKALKQEKITGVSFSSPALLV